MARRPTTSCDGSSSWGYARPIQTGALHCGRLFHVHRKPLYAAIGQGDNRHRKSMALGRMVERLMVLDAVLADRTFTWLGTEVDKRSYFIRRLQGRVELREFPRLTFGAGAESRHRYFPDKLPIGIQADRTDHVFLYLITSPVPMDFRLFLLRHAELLRPLIHWTIRVLVPEPFTKSIRLFGHAAREELATPSRPRRRRSSRGSFGSDNDVNWRRLNRPMSASVPPPWLTAPRGSKPSSECGNRTVIQPSGRPDHQS